eukprot:11838614-Prorocentrum_lima.AAC.1
MSSASHAALWEEWLPCKRQRGVHGWLAAAPPSHERAMRPFALVSPSRRGVHASPHYCHGFDA